jgi:hypothetical protein
VINGTAYDHDVIIHADGSLTGRNCGCTPELRVQMCQTYSQDYFHAPLAEWELDFLAEERPEVIIIGAGFRSMLPITPKAKAILAEYHTVVASTPRAMELVNAEHRRFVAVLHSTC